MAGAVLMDLEATADLDEFPVPSCSVKGNARGALHRPDEFPIWVATATLEPGAVLSWNAPHGEHVVFIRSGRLRHDDRTLGADSVVIVEADGQPVLHAEEQTSIVFFGGDAAAQKHSRQTVGGSPPPAHGVHLVGERGTHDGVFESDKGMVRSWFYADSTCPTCHPTLLRNVGPGGYRAASHSHSQDEIIYLLAGDIQVGTMRLEPGMAIAVGKDHRYGFRSTAGFDFINYRPGQSTVVVAPRSEPIVETADGFGMKPVLTH